MITFTKEQLIASAHARIEFAEMMLAGELEPIKERTLSIELELARIALASLEAEAVPPAQVSVPEPIKRNDADGWWMYKGRRVGGGCAEWYNRALDDCRAAMLQGVENAESPTTMQTAPALDSSPKFAESPSGNYPVIPDGWVMVPVEPTMSQEFAGYRTLTDTGKMSRLMKTRLSNIYRAMIAAAPQQEVKP